MHWDVPCKPNDCGKNLVSKGRTVTELVQFDVIYPETGLVVKLKYPDFGSSQWLCPETGLVVQSKSQVKNKMNYVWCSKGQKRTETCLVQSGLWWVVNRNVKTEIYNYPGGMNALRRALFKPPTPTKRKHASVIWAKNGLSQMATDLKKQRVALLLEKIDLAWRFS